MEKNYIKYLVIGLVLTAFAVSIYYISTKPEKTFISLSLSEDNKVSNFTEYPFYDTILKVGLSEMGLRDISVTVKPLTDMAKENAELQGITLEAHLREFLGEYYLFMNESSRDRSIEIIGHELIHLDQYNSKRLVYENDTLIWDNKKIARTEIPYDERPWEIEATSQGRELAEKIRNILYDKN